MIEYCGVSLAFEIEILIEEFLCINDVSNVNLLVSHGISPCQVSSMRL